MEDLEKIYDEQISPLMQQIIEICKNHDIPMFADFQYSDDGFCKTHRATGHPLFNHYNAICQCKGEGGVNIDKYMMWVMREAGKVGHNSIILNQLGVPLRPES